MFRSSIKYLALVSVIALLTSGCAVGFNAATNKQQASGNGRSANVGNIQIRNALIVRDKENPAQGTFVGTIINSSAEGDNLKGIEIQSSAGQSSPFPAFLESQKPISFGLDGQLSLPIQLEPTYKSGSFVKVQFDFENNASVPMTLLLENNDGIYSDVTIGKIIID